MADEPVAPEHDEDVEERDTRGDGQSNGAESPPDSERTVDLGKVHAGITSWVRQGGLAAGQAGRERAGAMAILAAMWAAAFAPILPPLVGGDIGAAASAALAQVGAVGLTVVTDSISHVVARLRRESARHGNRVETLREALADHLTRQLETDDDRAALRSELVRSLEAVGGLRVTVEAAMRSSDLEAVVRLVASVDELRGLGEETSRVLRDMSSDLTEIRVAQREDSHRVEQLLLRVNMLLGRSAAQPRADARPVDQSPAPEPLPTGRRPYPGLKPFDVSDSQWFHGRERLTSQLVTRLGERHRGPALMWVVGASGAGKSSLLRAGLIPQVLDGRLQSLGVGEVRHVLMTPGARPLRELATRLALRMDRPSEPVETLLSRVPRLIRDVVRQASLASALRRQDELAAIDPTLRGVSGVDDPPTTARLLIVIDQFEELFTLCDNERERRSFIRVLRALADSEYYGDPADVPPAIVVLGLRAGFVENCGNYDDLVPLLQDNQLFVGPMSAGELHDVIELPARDAGLEIEEGLAATMIRDLGFEAPASGPGAVVPASTTARHRVPPDAAGRLPLLAHALLETWERRSGTTLTLSGYNAAGGIQRAIGTTAEEVFAGLDPEGQRLLNRLMVHHLVVVGADDTEDARRRASRRDLIDAFQPSQRDTVERILRMLENRRLITVDEDAVEITHEALLQNWQRLRDWLNEGREWLWLRQRMTEAAHAWDAGGRKGDDLYRGTRLAAVVEQLDRDDARSSGLDPVTAAFLRYSRERQERERVRNRNRTVALVAGVVCFALLAATAGVLRGVAVQRGAAATNQRRIAQSRQLAATATALRDTNPEVSMLLSLESYRIDSNDQSRSGLLSTQFGYADAGWPTGAGAADAVAHDPADQAVVATADLDGSVTLWNTDTRQRIARLRADTATYSVAFSADGALVAAGQQNGLVLVWNTHTHQRVATLPGHQDVVDAVGFSPDGHELAAGGTDGTVTVWDAPLHGTQRPNVTSRPGTGPVDALTYGPGDILAVADADGIGELWPSGVGGQQVRLPGDSGPLRAIAVSPTGDTVATGGDDGTVRLWNARTGEQLAVFTGHAGQVSALAFDATGATLASASEDASVRLWDTASHRQVASLSGPVEKLTGVVFGDAGRAVVASSTDGTLWLWNVGAPGAGGPGVDSVATAGGGLLLTSGADHQPRLWDVARRSRLGTPNLADVATGSAMAVDQRHGLLAMPAGNGVALWNITSRRLVTKLTGAAAPVTAVAVNSNDGLVAACAGEYLVVWSYSDPRPLWRGTNQLGVLGAVAFDPAGTTIATGSTDRTIVLWRVTPGGHGTLRGIQPGPVLSGHLAAVTGLAFSPTGRLLASSSADHTVMLWTTSGDHVGLPDVLPAQSQAVTGVAFQPGGELLASTAEDHTVRLWDIATHTTYATLENLPSVSDVAFTGADTLAMATDDGTAVFVDTNPDAVATRICASAPPDPQSLLSGFLSGVPYKPLCG